jgi:hypothetical protein
VARAVSSCVTLVSLYVFHGYMTDVDALLSMHPGYGTRAWRGGRTGALLRATTVFMVTAWENYIEDVIRESFHSVLPSISQDPALLSRFLRDAVGRKASSNVWDVVGDGWLSAAEAAVSHEIESLNNPSASQVNGLVNKVLGFANFLDTIDCDGVQGLSAADSLTRLVNEIRGEIVHKGHTSEPLRTADVRTWKLFLERLVPAFGEELEIAVLAQYGVFLSKP